MKLSQDIASLRRCACCMQRCSRHTELQHLQFDRKPLVDHPASGFAQENFLSFNKIIGFSAALGLHFAGSVVQFLRLSTDAPRAWALVLPGSALPWGHPFKSCQALGKAEGRTLPPKLNLGPWPCQAAYAAHSTAVLRETLGASCSVWWKCVGGFVYRLSHVARAVDHRDRRAWP